MLSANQSMGEQTESCLKRLTTINPEGRIKLKLAESRETFDKVIHFCGHVKDMMKNVLPEICIDSHENIIANEKDYIHWQNYDKVYAFFKALYHDSTVEAIYKIREEKNSCWV